MAEGTCKLEGCGRTGRVILGWCVGHYTRWARTGDVGSVELRAPRLRIPAGSVCSVEDCERPVSSRGWCKAHASRWERHGDVQAHIPIGPAAQDKVRATCTIDDCGRPAHSKGLCKDHDGRRRRHGDPLAGKPIGEGGRGACSADGCGDPHYIKGYCIRHHYRMRRYGSLTGGFFEFDPIILGARGLTKEEQFWSYVDKEGPVPARCPDLGKCWQWRLSGHGSGYGQTSLFPEVGSGAHRVAWHLSGRALIDGMQLDHLCKNTGCVNPDHLEQVTPAVNNLRSDSWAGRNFRKTACGKGHPYDLLNTGWTKQGHRKCRTCANGKAERLAALRALSPKDRATSQAYRKAIANDPCRFCGAPGRTVDHFFAIAKGGGEDWFNLGPACARCNRSKGTRCGTWFALRRDADRKS